MSDERTGKLALGPNGELVAFRSVGTGEPTLVVVHGASGDHARVLPLRALAERGHRVVFYDQLGGGESDRPDPAPEWTIERAAEELNDLIGVLALDRPYVLGHSWGGMVAAEFALRHGDAIRGLILSNTAPSGIDVIRAVNRRRLELDDATLLGLLDGDRDALAAYTQGFLSRTVDDAPQPPVGRDGIPAIPPSSGRPELGPDIFGVANPLRRWDVRDRLHEITVPTLVVCGYYDSLGIEGHRTLADRIPGSEFVILGHTAHMPLFEREWRLYLAILADFLGR